MPARRRPIPPKPRSREGRPACHVHPGRPGDVNHGGWERVWVGRYSGEVSGRLDAWSHSAASAWQSSWWALHGARC